MKIYIKGNPNYERKDLETRMFHCHFCGCIFKANIYEYSHGLFGNYTCTCPNCAMSVYSKDNETIINGEGKIL